MDFMRPETVLNLQNIRDVLVRMEDTIIFNFIERAQFFESPSIYEDNKFSIENFNGSFLDWYHLSLEQVQSQVRRFESPDEVPFFPNQLKDIILPPINYPKILASYSDEININSLIKEKYIDDIVPLISRGEGEQPENLGSCATCDIDNLQALSRRIHFGKFVAESKFQNETEKYTKLIKERDAIGIEKAVTNAAVEEAILQRLMEKANVYGTDPTLPTSKHPDHKVNAEYLAKIYKDWVIPLTKKVEVDYLLRRLSEK